MSASSKEFRELFPKFTSLLEIATIESFITAANEVTYTRGDIIILESTTSNNLFFLLEGTLNAYVEKNGKRINLGETPPGSIIGEVSFFGDCPTTATVVAKTDCKMYVLGKAEFGKLKAEVPQFASQLLRTASIMLTNRLHNTDKKLCQGFIDQETDPQSNIMPGLVALYTNIYKLMHGHTEV